MGRPCLVFPNLCTKSYIHSAKILYVKGRQYSVKIQYTAEAQTDYIDAALKTCLAAHIEQPPGDILMFLTGEEEIENMASSIEFYSPSLKPNQLKVCFCSSELS